MADEIDGVWVKHVKVFRVPWDSPDIPYSWDIAFK
jgi:hypothetical protein